MHEESDAPLWRRCENAWADWLEESGALVMRHTDATSNTPHSGAPLVQVAGRRRRSPDLMSSAGGVSTYWEVKTRSRPDVDELTGQSRHWMPFDAFDDYVAVRERSGHELWVILYEPQSAVAAGRWLRIGIDRMRDVGFATDRWVAEGVRVRAWIWPVEEMEVVSGPVVEEGGARHTLAPAADERADQKNSIDLAPAERVVRRRRRARSPESTSVFGEHVSARSSQLLHEWIDSEPGLALAVLSKKVGLSVIPRYSVLRVGLNDVEVDDVLGFVDYGIRVTLVVENEPQWPADVTARVEALRAARLLEVAVVAAADSIARWVVDGALDWSDARLIDLLNDADASGEFNLAQYRIVHADPAADVVVEAGAGTGKTETMSERIVFLLATGSRVVEGGANPRDLRADDIALVTFTREAAAQMRERISQTLLVRQRLCSSCALPVLAWMLQLSGADISTIHGLARRVVSSSAGPLGLGPDFRVTSLRGELGESIQRAISSGLSDLVERYPKRVPAAYEWENHLASLWEALESHGVDLLRLGGSTRSKKVEWGGAAGSELEREVNELVRDALQSVAEDLMRYSIDNQMLATNQLVPSAIAAANAEEVTRMRRYRYVFVDEFQDTDPGQMELFIQLRQHLDLRLFVVGDVKQGVYRFRGASGGAFVEFAHRMDSRDLPHPSTFPLTRNFRSGRKLLDSLHPVFSSWGGRGWLPYDDAARLRARSEGIAAADQSSPFTTLTAARAAQAQIAAAQVATWWEAHRGESIGILCRHNSQALEVRRAIESVRPDDPIGCEILVGGRFFQTPAVLETRAFLQAVADPADDAALLELCETRWGVALLGDSAPPGWPGDDWLGESVVPGTWQQRVATLGTNRSFGRDDLEFLRSRVAQVAAMARTRSTLGWLVECDSLFQPARQAIPGLLDAEHRARYERCLDHLLTLLDSRFAESPLSLERLLAWVVDQVSMNRSEDEPRAATAGKVTALTVHKAKGLEFDRVIIPWTTTPFGPPKSASTQVAVRTRPGSDPRLMWKWKAPYQGTFTNVPPGLAYEWRAEMDDTVKEETRLLYVAMTRARRELVVVVKSARTSSPTSWDGLLNAAGA